MKLIKSYAKTSWEYIGSLVKWMFIAAVLGTLGGILGSVFHLSIDAVTELRVEHSWLIYLLPLGGLLIALLYGLFRSKGQLDTNRILESVREGGKVPLVMIPLIFISTVITHLFGGSAGREGAALQLGGGIGYNMGRAFRLNKNDMHIIVMTGMSSVFAALFGTPLTAAFFCLEVVSVGVLHYAALVPCVISAIVAQQIAGQFGIGPVRFDTVVFPEFSLVILIQATVLAVLCALVCIVFCMCLKKGEHYMDKLIPNRYLRPLVGSVILVLLTLVLRTYDYNGAGMDVITRALQGDARAEAFLLKIVFTAITIAAGFKGGEIVPAFFIGSTFGCIVGPLLGLEASFGAAIGFVALFCGVVNCPVASVFLSLEVFGTEGILIFALVCAVTYLMSGYFGLYRSQKIVYSKLNAEYIDMNTK